MVDVFSLICRLATEGGNKTDPRIFNASWAGDGVLRTCWGPKDSERGLIFGQSQREFSSKFKGLGIWWTFALWKIQMSCCLVEKAMLFQGRYSLLAILCLGRISRLSCRQSSPVLRLWLFEECFAGAERHGPETQLGRGTHSTFVQMKKAWDPQKIHPHPPFRSGFSGFSVETQLGMGQYL